MRLIVALLWLVLFSQNAFSAASIDGSASVEGGSGTSVTTGTFSTSGPAKVIVAVLIGAANVSSVTGASLTFTQRAAAANFPNNIELWEADAGSSFSSQSFTVNFDASTGYASAVAFAVADADDWDVNASLPDEQAGTTDPTVSTTAAETMIIGAFRFQTTASPTPPSGWTAIQGAGYLGVWYRNYTSAQSSLSIPDGGTGLNDSNAAIGDALAAAVSGSVIPVLHHQLRNQ